MFGPYAVPGTPARAFQFRGARTQWFLLHCFVVPGHSQPSRSEWTWLVPPGLWTSQTGTKTSPPPPPPQPPPPPPSCAYSPCSGQSCPPPPPPSTLTHSLTHTHTHTHTRTQASLFGTIPPKKDVVPMLGVCPPNSPLPPPPPPPTPSPRLTHSLAECVMTRLTLRSRHQQCQCQVRCTSGLCVLYEHSKFVFTHRSLLASQVMRRCRLERQTTFTTSLPHPHPPTPAPPPPPSPPSPPSPPPPPVYTGLPQPPLLLRFKGRFLWLVSDWSFLWKIYL